MKFLVQELDLHIGPPLYLQLDLQYQYRRYTIDEVTYILTIQTMLKNNYNNSKSLFC